MKIMLLFFCIFTILGCNQKETSHSSKSTNALNDSTPKKIEKKESYKLGPAKEELEKSPKRCLFTDSQIQEIKTQIIGTWRSQTHDLSQADLIDLSPLISTFVVLEAIHKTPGLPKINDRTLKSIIYGFQNIDLDDLESLDEKSIRKLFC